MQQRSTSQDRPSARLRCFGRSGPTGLLGAGNVRTHQQKPNSALTASVRFPLKMLRMTTSCGESLLEHYSQSWLTCTPDQPGSLHHSHGRVYIDRCVTKPIRGFKVFPCPCVVPFFRHSRKNVLVRDSPSLFPFFTSPRQFYDNRIS